MVRFNIECPLAFPAEQFWRIRDTPSFLDFIVTDGMLKKITVTVPEKNPDGYFTRTQHYCPANVQCPDFLRSVIGETMFEVTDEQRWIEEQRPFHVDFFIRPSFLTNLSRTFGEMIIQPFPDIQSEQDNQSFDSSKAEDYQIQNSIEQEMFDKVPNNQPHNDTNMKTCLTDSSDTSSDTLAQDSPANTNPELSDDSDNSDASDAETDCVDINQYIETLPPCDKSLHIVKGQTKVSILTVGWFIERAIVNNLKIFYEEYPKSIARFRQKLYKQFADGDSSIPIDVVVDRYMAKEAERMTDTSNETEETEEQMLNDDISPANVSINQSEQNEYHLAEPLSHMKQTIGNFTDLRISRDDNSGNRSPTSVDVQGQPLDLDLLELPE